MKAIQGKTLLAFQRVLSFLSTNAAVLGGVPQLTAVATLTALVNTLLASVSSQGASDQTKKGLTTQARKLRTALVVAMRPIAAIAKATPPSPTAIPALEAPPAKVSAIKLVGLANSMVEAATPYQPLFISAGLPATFLTDLSTAAANLNAAVTAQGTTKGQRINATKSVATAFIQARQQLDIIDPSVETALSGNAPLYTEWENIKRVSPKATTPTPTAKPVAPSTPTQEEKAA
jgi:hypothetical protein